MTEVSLTWQHDAEHTKAYNEAIETSKKNMPTTAALTDAVHSIMGLDPANLFKLEPPVRIAVALTLENCMDQLIIIKAFINEPSSRGAGKRIFKYRTLKERFALTPEAKQRKQEEEYEKIPYTSFHKLQDDISFICTTFTETSKEIQDKGLYTVLLMLIFSIDQEEEDIKELERCYQIKTSELNNIKKTILTENGAIEKQLLEANDQISEYKIILEDYSLKSKVEQNYIEGWEYARQYQNDMVLTNKEDAYISDIKEYQTKIDLETRIHGEINNFIIEITEDLQNAILYWMRHYDEEIERRDSEIYQMKMKWEELRENHTKLFELYEAHRIEIIDRLAIKEERRIKEELEMLHNRAAIRIQAWWRGTMVRKKLGPYRVHKGKKGDKGKKKGKGKNKGKK